MGKKKLTPEEKEASKIRAKEYAKRHVTCEQCTAKSGQAITFRQDCIKVHKDRWHTMTKGAPTEEERQKFLNNYLEGKGYGKVTREKGKAKGESPSGPPRPPQPPKPDVAICSCKKPPYKSLVYAEKHKKAHPTHTMTYYDR